jgi:hypothetical protein
LLDQRLEIGIEEHVAVFGVVDDVDELLVEQARIDRVQHAPGAGHPVIEFEVPPRIPGEGCDAIALAEAECCERACGALGACHYLPVIGPVHDARRIARDDLGFGVPGRDIIDQVRNQQRPVLHQSKHESPRFERFLRG